MSAFSCAHCGAALAIPEDERALDAKCAFCGQNTLLPQDIAAQRRRDLRAPDDASRADRTAAATRWLLIAAGGFAVMVAIGGLLSALLTHPAPAPPDPPRPPPPPALTEKAPAPPPPAEIITDPAKTGETLAADLMKRKYASGCKRAVLPPEPTSGEQSVETKLIKNGPCVTIFAVTGIPDNVLTLSMKTPLGEPLETPKPAAEIEFTVCPKTPGLYPTRIIPATNGPYTVAAIECPAHAARKKQP